jgi:hypothetical protein
VGQEQRQLHHAREAEIFMDMRMYIYGNKIRLVVTFYELCFSVDPRVLGNLKIADAGV